MTYEQSRAIARAAIAAGEASGQTWTITYCRGPGLEVVGATLREAVGAIAGGCSGLREDDAFDVRGPAGVEFDVDDIEWSRSIDAITAEIADMAEACCASLFGEVTL